MQKQIQVPDAIQAQADEFMAKSRARFGHGVFFMVENGQQGGNQGGSQGGDGSGGDQGQGGSGGSILDREAEGGDQGGDGGAGGSGGDGGQGGQGGSGDGGQQVNVTEIVTQVTQALESRFDSIADRRVNAILREVRNGQQGGGNQGGQQGGDGSGQQGGQGGGSSTHVSSGPAAADVREARLVYREYVGDQVRFLGDFEREAAARLAAGLLQERLTAGDDVETAGRETARTVAETVKGLRKQYESRIVAALRREGVIPAEAGQGGQPLAGPAKPGVQSGYQAGAAVAQRLLGDRMPQQQN